MRIANQPFLANTHTTSNFDNILTQNMRTPRSVSAPPAPDVQKNIIQNLGLAKIRTLHLPDSYNSRLPALSNQIGTYFSQSNKLDSAMQLFLTAIENRSSAEQLQTLGNTAYQASQDAERSSNAAKRTINRLAKEARKDDNVDLYTYTDITNFHDEIAERKKTFINTTAYIKVLADEEKIELFTHGTARL